MKKTENVFSADQNEAFLLAGQKLRTVREQKRMSQEDLAFEAKIDQSTLSKAERLGPQLLSWTKLISAAAALGCVVEISFRTKD